MTIRIFLAVATLLSIVASCCATSCCATGANDIAFTAEKTHLNVPN